MAHLKAEQVEHTLATKHSAIDVVAEEQVAGLLGVAALLHNIHKIVVLAVQVAKDEARGLELQAVRLLLHDLGGGID